MKGISMTMQIVIVVIILLVAAMVVLSVFGVQFGSISQTIGEWITGVPSSPEAVACTNLGEDECAGEMLCTSCCNPGPPKTFAHCIRLGGQCNPGEVAC